MASMILCTDENGGLGYKGSIPWYSKPDFEHFKKYTTNKIVVMGYNTWKTLPKKPLPKRLNVVVLSREYDNREDVDYSKDVIFINKSELTSFIENNPECVIIGGATLYKHALPYVTTIVHSKIFGEYACDTFFNLDEELIKNSLNFKLDEIVILDKDVLVEYWIKE